MGRVGGRLAARRVAVVAVALAAVLGAACSGDEAEVPATTTTAPVARLAAEAALLERLGDNQPWTSMVGGEAARRFPLVANDPTTSIYTGYAAARAELAGEPVEALVLRYVDADRADGEQLLLNHFAKTLSSREIDGTRVFGIRLRVEADDVEYRIFYDAPFVVAVQGRDLNAVDAAIRGLLRAG